MKPGYELGLGKIRQGYGDLVVVRGGESPSPGEGEPLTLHGLKGTVREDLQNL